MLFKKTHELSTEKRNPLQRYQIGVGNDKVEKITKNFRVRLTHQYVSTRKFTVYRYECHLEPIFAWWSDTKLIELIEWKPEASNKYRISSFEIRTDKNIIKTVRLKNQFHPHRDPKTGFLCLDKNFKDQPISDEKIDCMAFLCLTKFNVNDCYQLPNMLQHAKEITQCQIF
jgi:hypothetical protein